MSRVGKNVRTFNADVARGLSDDNERAQTLYFNWLCVLVHADDYFGKQWYILANILHDIEYYWTVANDDNRAADGVKLREIWLSSLRSEAEDLGVGIYVPEDALNGPCTMLEMMVGLASAIESDIMQNDGEGNRTWMWFWHMVSNLLITNGDVGNWWVDTCHDDMITPADDIIIKEMVRRCLDRDYDYNGHYGCLFPVDGCLVDRKDVEIWYQAQDWLSSMFGDELYN